MPAQQTVNVIVRACTLGSTDQHNSECMDFPPEEAPVTRSERVIRIYAWLDWEGVLENFAHHYYVSRIVIRGAETKWVKGEKLYKIVVAVY